MDKPHSSAENQNDPENSDFEDAFVLDVVEIEEDESDSDSKNFVDTLSDKELVKDSSNDALTEVFRKQNNPTKNNSKFICNVCSKIFYTKSDLVVHFKIHLPPKKRKKNYESFVCETCNMVFRQKYKYEVHVKTIHTLAEPDNLDGNIFPHNLRSKRLRQNYMKNVLQKATESNFRSFSSSPLKSKTDEEISCAECDKNFKQKTELILHWRQVHEKSLESNRYGCHAGEYPFTKKHAFQGHIKKHRTRNASLKKSSKHFECAECGNKFSKKYNLVAHLKTIHKQNFLNANRTKPFLCTHCGKKFSQKHTLKVHIRSLHPDVKFEDVKEKRFSCFVCKKKFSQNYNLKVHLQTIHNLTDLQPQKEKPFICSVCAKRFRRKYTLRVHFGSIHGLELEPRKEKKFACPTCNRLFSRKPNLLRHSMKLHPQSANLQCLTCRKKFLTEEEIRIHVEKCSRTHALQTLKHERAKNRVILQTVVCALCQLTLHKVADMRRHYQNEHDLDMSLQCLTFSSDEEFLVWKYEEETNNRCSFSRYRSYQIQKAKYVDYFCSRSGYYKDKNRGLRGRRAIGSKKINACCPAQIKVKYLEDSVFVKYLPTHVGHDNKLCYMNLTKIERELIVDELRKGLAPQEILQRIKYPLPDSEEERRKIHLLTVQDIRNIAVTAGVDYKKGRFRDQKSVGSLATWIDEHVDSVLYYKSRDRTDKNFPCLEKDDFLLVIMTDKQRHKLQNLGDLVVMVDSAYGSDKNEYMLTTLMVLDGDEQSYPCSFMFSNRLSDTFLCVFYECVRANVLDHSSSDEKLYAKTFMSGTQECYYSSWIKVFPQPRSRLYCPWHVLKSWRDNLNKITLGTIPCDVAATISSDELRKLKSRTYKFLKYDLMQQRDRPTFHEELDTFLRMDSSLFYADASSGADITSPLCSFLTFFKQTYLPKTEMWAYCYREKAGLKPSAFTESFHKILKYQHLAGSKVRQLDQALVAVVAYLEKKNMAEILREEKGPHDLQKLRTLRRRHANSLKGDKLSIMTLGPNEWIVPSGSSKQHEDELCESYYVRRRTNDCVNCYLLCRECGVCFHDFECTCTDYCIFNNMCKHIHLLCQSDEVILSNVERIKDPLMVVEEEEDEEEEIIYGLEEPDCVEEVEYEIINTADAETLADKVEVKDESVAVKEDEVAKEIREEDVVSPLEKYAEVREQFDKVISGISSSPQMLNMAKKWVQQFSSIISACEKQTPAANTSEIETDEKKVESHT